MSNVLKDKIVTARKRHICDECLNDINQGERYNYCAHIYEGDFCVWKSHQNCRELACILNREFMQDEYYPLHTFSADAIEKATEHTCHKK